MSGDIGFQFVLIFGSRNKEDFFGPLVPTAVLFQQVTVNKEKVAGALDIDQP